MQAISWEMTRENAVKKSANTNGSPATRVFEVPVSFLSSCVVVLPSGLLTEELSGFSFLYFSSCWLDCNR